MSSPQKVALKLARPSGQGRCPALPLFAPHISRSLSSHESSEQQIGESKGGRVGGISSPSPLLHESLWVGCVSLLKAAVSVFQSLWVPTASSPESCRPRGDNGPSLGVLHPPRLLPPNPAHTLKNGSFLSSPQCPSWWPSQGPEPGPNK